ncbi:sugar diacid recognition domain-containing protein [Pullulanibacillus sp. KACC 23026]|uniref:CdaR family transcriptional regulator n=1 Tax=Pullulanibacillus sp. KACC 23026 TaxID=3028315 RepID=UPI0023B1558D|nr:sugar diacid recognition domain-containing protein [Pullulanibacillus sp. KACC 23026]WEG13214.1 sugar diacid recognition domain-containing protein [Pullulanibacillus sp. KACC 23026]
MEITYELAQPIIEKINLTLNYHLNIMNQEGIIVASSDPARIQSIHSGALEVVQSNREKIIDRMEKGAKPGVNLPIHMHGNCIGVVGITGDPKAVLPIAKIVKLTTETLINQKYLIDKLRYESESIKEWLLDLTKRSNLEVNELANRASLLGIDVQKSCAILLIRVFGLDHPQTQLNKKFEMIDNVSRFLSMNTSAHFLSHLGNGLFALGLPTAKAYSKKASMSSGTFIENQLHKKKLQCAIGIGGAYETIPGYRKSYEEAEQCLRLIELKKSDQNVMHIEDWGILRLLDKVPEAAKTSFIEHYLRDKLPLAEELMQTLQLFLELDQDIESTAKALHIHRNTLVYRLEKIKTLWHLDPRTFSDALILHSLLFFI